jgi:hypothetical protein
MTAGTLWIEVTIAGSIYVTSLFFWIMGWRYPAVSLEWFARSFQPYLAYVAVAFVALSYIAGFVAHRAIQIAKLFVTQNNGIKNFLESGRWPRLSSDLDERMGEETSIWALSPERIHHELDFQFAQLALLRSLLFSSPILALSVIFWRDRSCYDHLGTVVLYFGGFYLCLVPSFLRQSRQYEKIRRKVLAVAHARADDTTPRFSPASGSVGETVTITGSNFGEAQGTSSVTFNGIPATPKRWDKTRVDVVVPANATIGDIVLAISEPSNAGATVTIKFSCQFKIE